MKIRWAGHVEHVGEKRDVYRVTVGKPLRVHFEDLDMEGKMNVFMWLRTRASGGLLQT
jgi:hypothetical protein